MTKAHGHDTTKNVSALYPQSNMFVCVISGGINAMITAKNTTIGV